MWDVPALRYFYFFVPCSSLHHDRSTGLFQSVINCDMLCIAKMLRS
jgi:hypothetical protein